MRAVGGSFLSVDIRYSKLNYNCLSRDIKYSPIYLNGDRYSDDESLEAHSVSLALASENPSLALPVADDPHVGAGGTCV
jgi:hypothetical protein